MNTPLTHEAELRAYRNSLFERWLSLPRADHDDVGCGMFAFAFGLALDTTLVFAGREAFFTRMRELLEHAEALERLERKETRVEAQRVDTRPEWHGNTNVQPGGDTMLKHANEFTSREGVA